MNRGLRECHEHFIYWLFRDAVEGQVLEIGNTDITEGELSAELDYIQEDVFEIIDDIPEERWEGGAGPFLDYNEMGLIGGIAICNAINRGVVRVDFVENFDLGADYAYIQN